MKGVKINKLDGTYIFYKGDAEIHLYVYYQSKTFEMTHDCNDMNVTFNESVEEVQLCLDRADCVKAALLFAKNELIKSE